MPRLAHVHSRTRMRVAAQDWWNTETTHNDGQKRKDWKQMFKLRHNWRKGRCAVSEMDISPSPQRHTSDRHRQTSFWDEPVVPVSALLVQFDGKIFVAADKDAGLRAWDIGDGGKKMVGCRRFRDYEDGWRLGEPTALAIDGTNDVTDVIVGYASGAVIILRLDPTFDIIGEFGFRVRFILPPRFVPQKILHLGYSHPYLLTLNIDNELRVYIFESDTLNLSQPRELATLHAQALRGPCNLNLRKSKPGSDEITASIAYSMPLIHGGWSVGIQEIA